MIQLLNKLYWRFVAPSPIAFHIINWILNITLFIGGVQEFLSMFDIHFTPPYDVFTYKFFLVSAGVGRLLSGMTVKPETK